jgi:hypothetical protein
MIRDSGIGGNWTDPASSRAVAQAPLLFPSADGPERRSGAGSPALAPADVSISAWPLAPALIGALCGTALVSIALHDVLALPAHWAALLTLALAVVAGWLLARRLNRPLQNLSRRAEQLAVRYTGRAVVRGHNESKNLEASFEAMTGALLSQLERLQGLHLDEMQNSLELQRRYALMRLLRDLSTAALECERLDQVLERAVEELGAYLDWPIGRVLFAGETVAAGERARRSVWFVTERERFARFITASEDAATDRSAHGLIGRADATGMPHWVTDLARLDGWPRRDLALQTGLKSGFVIPIAPDGTAPAFIEFFADHRVEASVEMVELIEAIQTELWQAGERRRKRFDLDASTHRLPAPESRSGLDALRAAGP